MTSVKLFSLFSILSILVLTSNIVPASDWINIDALETMPRFQISIENQLAEQVGVILMPIYYNPTWDGVCTDIVYSTTNKIICKNANENYPFAGESHNGIPAGIQLGAHLPYPDTDAEVHVSSRESYDLFGELY